MLTLLKSHSRFIVHTSKTQFNGSQLISSHLNEIWYGYRNEPALSWVPSEQTQKRTTHHNPLLKEALSLGTRKLFLGNPKPCSREKLVISSKYIDKEIWRERRNSSHFVHSTTEWQSAKSMVTNYCMDKWKEEEIDWKIDGFWMLGWKLTMVTRWLDGYKPLNIRLVKGESIY